MSSDSPPKKGPDAQERRLVRRLKQGDERAFQELVETYQDRVFSLVMRMMGNRQEAEDIAQEVFFSVYRAMHRFRGDARLYTWIYRIAINACKSRLKYLKGRQLDRQPSSDEATGTSEHTDQHTGISLQSAVPGPEAAVRGNRLQQAIARELANLDPDHRQVLVLRDIQGLSYDDITKITGLAQGTVKSRLHRARVALKSRLKTELGEQG